MQQPETVACWQVWLTPLQVSVVQASPSLQSESLRQQLGTVVKLHLPPLPQASSVQASPSLQSFAVLQQPAFGLC